MAIVCHMLALAPNMGTGEAARRLGVSRRTILRWVREGRIRAYATPTNRNRVLVEDVERVLAEMTGSAQQSAADPQELERSA